ncbi:MAG TPA: LCP family protein [Gaiellaceae bacterium]|nr:LCP family protein [Gaiellaceae bacterium]
MRTTLKRGIGQAGGHSGNGHSAAPPLFGPMARYHQPGPARRSVTRLILRAFGWLVVAAAVIGSGAAGGFYLYGHESLAQVVNPPGLGKSRVHLAYVQPGQPAIALVAGYDVRGKTSGANPYAGSNSDTLMLLRADPRNHTLSLLSFPRDLWVDIYCHGATVDTQSRINSAWGNCSDGPAGTLDTIEKLTGLQINYFITLDFHAFKQLVNQLHGVYINVDRRYYNPLHTGYSAINLHPGYQKLTGGAALSYVRYRHTDSDVYRTGRQQLFIEALKSRLRTSLTLTNFFYKLPGVFGVLKRNLSVGTASGQKVGLDTLKSYLGLLYDLPPGHLIRNQIPIGDLTNTVIGGADVLQASPGAVQGAVQRFLHPIVPPAAGSGHKKKTGPKKKVPKLPKSQISTLVLNAGTIAGEAANTSYLLTQQGYTTKTLPASDQANAPKVTRDTTLYFDPVQPNAQRAAQQLQPLFGSHTRVVQMTSAIAALAQQAGNPLTVVAVGTSFGGKLVVHHRVKLPTQPQQPAQVSEGAGITAPALRHVYDEVHFPLMVPHEIAQGATLSDSEGVRGFKPIGHQHEAVLTFVQPDGIEYWQIEESTWNSAPILQNPSYSFVHRGQKFQVYTTGGSVQMVALRTSRATYWVVNTILNELSNKTMLAIAESFRPLQR